MNRCRWTHADEVELCRMRWVGYTAREIAHQLGRTLHSVNVRLARLGGMVKDYSYTYKRDVRIRELHRLGWTDRDISRDIGCHPWIVWNTRRRMKLPANAKQGYYRKPSAHVGETG